MTIEKAIDLDKSNFIDSASRYRKSDLIYYGDMRKIAFSTYKRTKYVPTSDDKFYIISGGTQYRPDLVSYRAYGDSRYWWKIMEVNGIFDIMEFKSGTNILIPSLAGL